MKQGDSKLHKHGSNWCDHGHQYDSKKRPVSLVFILLTAPEHGRKLSRIGNLGYGHCNSCRNCGDQNVTVFDM
jgi:hypothetical protein